MYGYGEYIPLSPEEILKRISEKEIFKVKINQEIIVDKEVLYKAPYRNDENPDCWFEEYEGVLYFVDFADIGSKSKNCFRFIGRVYNLSYRESLEFINSEFKLGLGDNLNKVKEVLLENDCVVEEKKIKRTSKERAITITPRIFNDKDRQFWSKYNISKENLTRDKVIPVEMYRSTSRKGQIFTVRPLDICYAYTDFPDGKMKIYRPQTLIKEAKWFTNCNQNDIGSLEHLPERVEDLYITKSYKDCRVVRNLELYSIWFQNEGMFPSKTLIEMLCSRARRIIVWFDNDSAGISNGMLLVSYINTICPGKAIQIYLPPNLLVEDIKDPSDLVEKKDKENLTNFLQNKQLLQF